VIDALVQDRHIIAPDWRGYGLTHPGEVDNFWFPDYLADLDALIDHFQPEGPIDLLGHSMGGNVAGIYAGVRPHRVAKLVNLEGFGLAATEPTMAPARYAQWLDELREPPSMRAYETIDGVIARLMKTNPRLARDRAEFLAAHWSAQNENGQWEILGDPAHKITGATLYRVEEVIACWEKITAPVLWVEANDSDLWRWMGGRDKVRAELDRRRACIPHVKSAVVNDAGHMLHHDQPELLARLIEDFLV
jgi:pimeloyl-ACP methyl ester carboxylesterase